MKTNAIAFDFDGTLVYNGDDKNDKNVHVLYSSYAACHATAFHVYLSNSPKEDLQRMMLGVDNYPGAPRYQQLAACVNALITGKPVAAADPSEFGVPPELQAQYKTVREVYNRIYNELNEAAAAKWWLPIPGIKDALTELARQFDLFVASGVMQSTIEKDFLHYGFDRSVFVDIWGADPQGGTDKGELLKRIKARGYKEVLFVGDSSRDLEYAQAAGVKFFRIRNEKDVCRLLETVKIGLPDEQEPWRYVSQDKDHFVDKATLMAERLRAGKPMTPAEATDWINNK